MNRDQFLHLCECEYQEELGRMRVAVWGVLGIWLALCAVAFWVAA